MVKARNHTSARDAQHLCKLGSQSAYAPEGRESRPSLPSLYKYLNRIYHGKEK